MILRGTDLLSYTLINNNKKEINSTFVFLPHNFLFEGKISGIFSDSISLFTPVISDKISPVADFFNYYGSLGYIYDFNSQKWCNEFLEQNIEDYYETIIDNIESCINNHSLTTISSDFISIINETQII